MFRIRTTYDDVIFSERRTRIRRIKVSRLPSYKNLDSYLNLLFFCHFKLAPIFYMTHLQYSLVVGLNSVYSSTQISTIKLQKQNNPMKTRIFTILFLLLMSVASFLPFPTTTLICLYTAIFRPRWFKVVTDEVYKSKIFD